MNVIVANRALEELSNLDIDLLKSVNGEYDASELVSMFKNFFFNKMILDITAIKDYANISNIQKISIDLDPSKIILYLPNDPIVNSDTFLSQLVSMGFYNFTTNLDGVKYLLEHTNSYRDVAHIQNVNSSLNNEQTDKNLISSKIIGIRNLTEHAGATTLAYMLFKESKAKGLNTYAIEVDKHDFSFFNDMYMKSTSDSSLAEELLKFKNADCIFVDLNNSKNEEVCTDVIYLLEPSIVKLNKLLLRDKTVFQRLKSSKIILNQNVLNQDDINNLEYEAKIKFFQIIPPINDRELSEDINHLLIKLGIVANSEFEKKKESPFNKLFNIFKDE